MGGKRGNENAQMSKEEYEALQHREEAAGDDDDGNAAVTQGFQRAPSDEIKRRRVVKARRPRERPEGERNAGAIASSTSNPFAALASMTTTTNSSTTASSMPTFNFGTSASANDASVFANFGTTSSTPTAAATTTPTFPTASTTTPTPATAAATTKSNSNTAFDMEKALLESLQAMNDGSVNLTRLDHIIKSAAQQIHEWAQANPNKAQATAKDEPKDESMQDAVGKNLG